MNLEKKIEWIAMLHRQNLNGRETDDELFETGIRIGFEYGKEEFEKALKISILLLMQTTEFEVLESFKFKVAELQKALE